MQATELLLNFVQVLREVTHCAIEVLHTISDPLPTPLRHLHVLERSRCDIGCYLLIAVRASTRNVDEVIEAGDNVFD